MLLSPRYDGAPVIAMTGPNDDQRDTVIRQRRRMERALTALTDEQWASASRCDGWTCQDVVAHLIGTNRFWAGSINAGLAGEPTRFLAAFDPAATPTQMVEPMRSMTPGEVLAQFVDTNRGIFDAIESLDDEGWSTLAEAPPGHVPIRLVAHHALWDSWVHERDVLLALGITPAEEPDEVISCLRYVAALAPALVIPAGSANENSSDLTRTGSIVIDVIEPDAHIVIEVGETVAVHDGAAPAGACRLSGRAVDLVEILSIRAPFDQPVPDEGRWLLSGLAEVFDAASC
jgi:uncharacterized protein (TIGR03083 family)